MCERFMKADPDSLCRSSSVSNTDGSPDSSRDDCIRSLPNRISSHKQSQSPDRGSGKACSATTDAQKSTTDGPLSSSYSAHSSPNLIYKTEPSPKKCVSLSPCFHRLQPVFSHPNPDDVSYVPDGTGDCQLDYQRKVVDTFQEPQGTTNGPLPSTRPSLDVSGTHDFSRAVCAVCGDKASGRHYDAITCEGCKGFFKRTVRKMLTYTCHGNGNCILTRQKRTRCQACRYAKCLEVNMKREAVQEERHHASQRCRKTDSNCGQQDPAESVESKPNESPRLLIGPAFQSTPGPSSRRNSSSFNQRVSDLLNCNPEFTMARLLSAEMTGGPNLPTVCVDIGEDTTDPLLIMLRSVEVQLPRLLHWARRLPYFGNRYISLDDQLNLIRHSWADLLIFTVAVNSTSMTDGILLSNGYYISRYKAGDHGLGPLVERFIKELVHPLRELRLDRIEIALLRAIILFNPFSENVTASELVDSIRDHLLDALHSYFNTPGRPSSRYTQLLNLLNPLRTITEKCLEHLLMVKLSAEDPICRRFWDMIENDVWPACFQEL